MRSRRVDEPPHLLRVRRSVRLAVAFLKVTLVLLTLQMTGVPQMARELGWLGEDTDCCDTCPNDANGERCPPNCPECACSHLRVASLPPRGDYVLEVLAPDVRLAPPPVAEVEAPRAPFPPSLYRPPRSPRRSV